MSRASTLLSVEADGDRACRNCEGLTWTTKRNAKKCKTQQLDCKPGYYVVKNQRKGITNGNIGPPSCEQCPESTFSTTVNAMKCTPWRNCQAEGMIVAKVGTPFRDNKCRNCGPGECIHAVNDCPPGNFIKNAEIAEFIFNITCMCPLPIWILSRQKQCNIL